MRLSTERDRDEARAVATIHAALDAGVTLLDTADAYALDDRDIGHNERLVARALGAWRGDRGAVTVATKGGLTRPRGKWKPNGRAKHLEAACEASLEALGVEAIDLYQLHTVDPEVSYETSVRALAKLHKAGKVRKVGLCNVNVDQIERARKLVEVWSVQVAVSPWHDHMIRGGVVEYCNAHGIRVIAHSPFGGPRSAARVDKDKTLAAIAQRHEATPHAVAISWLRALGRTVIPIPGATRPQTAAGLGRVPTLRDEDRAELDARFPAGALCRTSRADRKPSADADGDVVLIVGMPAAGKTSAVHEFTDRGYVRLNRDQRGGTLAKIAQTLDRELAAGGRRFVLDNTYATRAARNLPLETAWAHGVPVRCVWVDTPLEQAQINAVVRLVAKFGRLPTVAEIDGAKGDDNVFGPNVLFRYARGFEPPSVDEGFVAIDRRPFSRNWGERSTDRAVVVDADLLQDAEVAEALAARAAGGWRVLVTAWRPEVTSGQMTLDDAEAALADRCRQLGPAIDCAVCPHPPGPPICWCRKPLPGLVVAYLQRHRLDPERGLFVATKAADRTLATRLGMPPVDRARFVANGT